MADMPAPPLIRKRQDRRPLYVALIVGLVHLMLVGKVAHFCLQGTDADWPMAWALFIFLDFPVSLIQQILPSHPALIHLSADPNSTLNDVGNFWQPLFVFGVLGTAWWSGLCAAITKLFAWLHLI